VKKILPLTVTVLVIIVFLAYVNITGRMVFNDEFVQGNTSGNILNDGLFCEYKNKIYFANPNDDNSLYVMNDDCTNFKRISSDITSHINVAGKYIIYARKSRTTTKNTTEKSILRKGGMGIYRTNLKGKQQEALFDNTTGVVNLAGNYVYYQHYEKTEGLTLYKVKIDDRPGTKIFNAPVSPTAIKDGFMYYNGVDRDHNIYKMELSTQASDLLYEGNCSNLVVTDDYIYFFNLDKDYTICRISLDGKNPEEIVSERCSTYNLSNSGKYLYYQVDNINESRICRMNLETMEETTLMKGNFCNINVTSNYVFFKAFDTEMTYIVPVGESTEVSQFDPPVQKN